MEHMNGIPADGKGEKKELSVYAGGTPMLYLQSFLNTRARGRVPDFSCAVTAGTRQVSTPGGCLLQKILQVLSDTSRAEEANAK